MTAGEKSGCGKGSDEQRSIRAVVVYSDLKLSLSSMKPYSTVDKDKVPR